MSPRTILPHNHNQHLEQHPDMMPASEDFKTVAQNFKQLADPTRISIFWLLCHAEECVFNIAAIMGMSSPAVLHHLKLLKDGDLIESRKDGKEVYYKAAKTPVADALHHMIENMMNISCPEAEYEFEAYDCPCCHGDEHRHIIHEVHDYLTEDLSRRVTIEELSKMFLINTSSLKAQFKTEYGLPIAAYMKQCRIEKAKELLTATGYEIGRISEMVGFGHHGKFTAAFREATGLLPSEYRRINKA